MLVVLWAILSAVACLLSVLCTLAVSNYRRDNAAVFRSFQHNIADQLATAAHDAAAREADPNGQTLANAWREISLHNGRIKACEARTLQLLQEREQLIALTRVVRRIAEPDNPQRAARRGHIDQLMRNVTLDVAEDLARSDSAAIREALAGRRTANAPLGG